MPAAICTDEQFIEASFDLDLEDTVIERLSTGLLAVIKDNPRFIAYLRRRK